MRKLKNMLTGKAGCLALLLSVLASIVLTPSCKEEGGAAGAPVIRGLRVTNPELADSTFTDVSPGSMIVVMGENLSGVKEVYVNNQEISFNSTYNTSTSLIITIPADEDFQLSGPNPEIPSELRIVTGHGIATYPLHVLSPGPVLAAISAFYPIEPGDEISLVGENFYEIRRIYFTRDSVNVTEQITDYTVSPDYEEVTFTVPDKVNEPGWIIMECYTSDASIELVPEGPEAEFTGISSTMPLPGSEVRIWGKNLIDVSRININGEIDIYAEDIEVSQYYDEVTFTMPRQVPTKSGTLTVTTISGDYKMPEKFYPREYVVLDWDNVGSFSWGGYSQVYEQASGEEAPYTSDGKYSGIVGTITYAERYWWGQTINATVWPGDDVIPADTPVSRLELQFECYVTERLNGPVLQIMMGGNYGAALQNYVPVSVLTGETEIGEWMQCSVPLTSLMEEETWGDFCKRVNEPGENGEIPANNQLGVLVTYPTAVANSAAYVEIYFDNFRVVPVAFGHPESEDE